MSSSTKKPVRSTGHHWASGHQVLSFRLFDEITVVGGEPSEHFATTIRAFVSAQAYDLSPSQDAGTALQLAQADLLTKVWRWIGSQPSMLAAGLESEDIQLVPLEEELRAIRWGPSPQPGEPIAEHPETESSKDPSWKEAIGPVYSELGAARALDMTPRSLRSTISSDALLAIELANGELAIPAQQIVHGKVALGVGWILGQLPSSHVDRLTLSVWMNAVHPDLGETPYDVLRRSGGTPTDALRRAVADFRSSADVRHGSSGTPNVR